MLWIGAPGQTAPLPRGDSAKMKREGKEITALPIIIIIIGKERAVPWDGLGWSLLEGSEEARKE